MKINVKKVKKNLIKAYATVAVAANTIALNATAFAAEGGGSGAPEGVDTSNYDALLNIIFWAAGILIIACSCLKSGLSFSQAMETISKDMDAPISSEFALVIKEMSMGSSMEEALDKMSTRIKSKHLQLMISAVLVQRQTGGNLSQILENISDTIKDRMKLQQELKSATASGKMSGTIVGCMPVAILGMFALVNSDFVTPMFHEKIGIILLCVAGGLELLCFLLIKKITTIKM